MEDNDSKFRLAVDRGEVSQFLVGEFPYFIDGRMDNDTPQNMPSAMGQVHMYWRETKDPSLESKLVEAILYGLEWYPDRNRFVYAMSSWMWLYHYTDTDKRNHPSGHFLDFPKIDFSAAMPSLRQALEGAKESLIADQRWAGAPGNSDAGLWEPICRTAGVVKEMTGGRIDYVPREA